MGAPIHTPEMAGANVHTFTAPGGPMTVPVRQWKAGGRGRMGYVKAKHRGWIAFWRTPEGVQVAYAGSHPGDCPRNLWRAWVGAAQDLEFWNAARRPLTVTYHTPAGTSH